MQKQTNKKYLPYLICILYVNDTKTTDVLVLLFFFANYTTITYSHILIVKFYLIIKLGLYENWFWCKANKLSDNARKTVMLLLLVQDIKHSQLDFC